jgi:N-acetylmuramoyl-L-alanine amidase
MVHVDANDTGATVTVDSAIDVSLATSGAGQIGNALAAAPSDAWKYGSPAPPPPGSNPRLIVIDPGHGGSDTGAMHNGLVEKSLTLDISQRLRAILVSRGWTVKMTRERDVDVVAPNDDARTELQGRCDVANNAGARLFVSVHINSFTQSYLNGTTTYFYKPNDQSFAAMIQRRLISLLGTKDDGARRENFYVVRHTTMPAVLVETAFLSNPDDAARLKSPAFLQNVAQGIADGIADYAGPPSNAPAQSSFSGE